MKRMLIGAFLSASLFFFWGFAFWVVLPVGPMVFRQMGDETALADQIKRSVTQPGSYLLPGMELMTSNPVEYTRRHETGPRATLFVYPAGRPVMSPLSLLGGFATMLAATLLMACVLRIAAIAGYFQRAVAVALAGMSGICLGDLGFPFWYDWPWELWLASAAFHVCGWLLASLTLAAIVRPMPTSGIAEIIPRNGE